MRYAPATRTFRLIPLALAARLTSGGTQTPAGLIPPPALINTALAAIIGSERFLVRTFNVPFGLSLLLTARVR